MRRQGGLYQNKVNSSLYSTCNCKMGYFSYDKKVVHCRCSVQQMEYVTI